MYIYIYIYIYIYVYVYVYLYVYLYIIYVIYYIYNIYHIYVIWNCIIFLTPRLVKKVITNLKVGTNIIKGVSYWLHSSSGSKELWTWAFIHTIWTLQYVSDGILFSRLVECLIGGPCIWECWGKVKTTTVLVFFQWLVKSLKNFW